MNKAVFLDRDGVINRKPHCDNDYITRWEEVEILPGVAEAIVALNRAGFYVIVVTNQRGIAKGLVTTAELESIHQRIREQLGLAGARIDAIYWCPHELIPPCGCRKPAPGMLLKAARCFNVDLTASWMVGDSPTDVEAGKIAGCRTVRLISDARQIRGSADIVASSLLAAIPAILKPQSIKPVNCEMPTHRII